MLATLRTNFSCVTIAPHENPNSKRNLLRFDAKKGGRMRPERTPINGIGEPVGYTFFFQIANDGGRRACCVKIDASNTHEALALFRQKWSVIEVMARDGINSGGDGDGVITLVMP
jgi:hypothetical protein